MQNTFLCSLLFSGRLLTLTSLLTSSSTGGIDARGNPCTCSLLRSCDVLLATSRASLMRMDSARRMKEANRFMWMLFLMQCSFLRAERQLRSVFTLDPNYRINCTRTALYLNATQTLFPLHAVFDVEQLTGILSLYFRILYITVCLFEFMFD